MLSVIFPKRTILIAWIGVYVRVDLHKLNHSRSSCGFYSMHASFKFVQLLLFFLFLTPNSEGADFFQFRGKSGQGIDTQSDLPTQWSDDSNLIWKSEIAGRGSSSPIVVGDQVFLTAYSGYGNLDQSGSQDKLVRQLLCYSLKDGKQLWKAEVENKQREDVYQGFITEHGYATSTPVSDGESVFVFFGKSGVLAFDMNGKQKSKIIIH